ncbi:NAD(P)H-binding protein [Mycobacterium shigaense]|uniref:Oxidoreductase n=1 Tax=Mycobacterium shigaense TaxID=722731 RepID=A0A1Z4EM35_9MYCO|nr:NAD(P)H-binding protein [Mycobacterium shigaense]MEA1120910.1 NAD(P)H-binding protein [Mycobacterium shigaense]PRI14708.1 NAD-dependent epimerase [Mycobacterium shigaense]BAX93991.1 oxidoreductase [Mycobacterium shigaense]
MRILVTGATGYVGSRLVTALLAAQHEVVAATRNPERLKSFGWFDQVAPVRLDASDAESAQAALADVTAAGDPIDVVYYLVHAIGQHDFRDADNAAAANVAAAARDAGVGRIVYLGGFVPGDETLSEHLASRAEVARALTVEGGPELVWLGAAIILGAGSTSFEMLRYVADRFPVIPTPPRLDNPIDPISIRDVLHYLVAAADPDRVPAGAYDISGPETTSYRRLLKTYARVAGRWQLSFRVPGFQTAVTARLLALTLPVPYGLAGDLVDSLDHPMVASVSNLRDRVPDPPGGLLGVEDAIALALAGQARPPRPVNALADPHDLADTDPEWAGGDALRARRFARMLGGGRRTGRSPLIALTLQALSA